VLHVELVSGNSVDLVVAAKGGGSENKAKFAMLEPTASIADWVLEMIPTMGAGWCPPGIIGIGIGGTAEQAMLLAKKALMSPVNMAQLKEKKPPDDLEGLRVEL
jgi:fumarate hydratase class I